jgi:hypothetical protein
MIDPDLNNQPSSNRDRPRSNKIYRISKFSSAGIQVFAPSRNREMRKERGGTGLSSPHHICVRSVSDTRVHFLVVVPDSVGPTFIRSRRSVRPSQGRRGPTHFFSWRSFSRDKRERERCWSHLSRASVSRDFAMVQKPVYPPMRISKFYRFYWIWVDLDWSWVGCLDLGRSRTR